MNKLVMLASLATAALISSIASASSIKNTNKDMVVLTVDMGKGHKGVLKLAPGGSYNSGGKEVSYSVGGGAAVPAKMDDQLIIQGTSIIPDPNPAKTLPPTTAPGT